MHAEPKGFLTGSFMSVLTLEEARCSFAAEVLSRQGNFTLKAFGASMLPALWPGDFAVIQSCRFEDAQAGDIVLYSRAGRFYLHRVIGKASIGDNQELITRGDSMPAPDPPVHPDAVLGKVVQLRQAGGAFAPVRQLSMPERIVGRILGRFNFCMRLVLWGHARRKPEHDLSVTGAEI